MKTSKLVKLATLNTSIAVLDVALFSKGLIGISLLGAGAMESAIGFTAAIMSGIVFLVGNSQILNEKQKAIAPTEIKTPEDCINALRQAEGKRTFAGDISMILEQTERFSKKKRTINDILLQKFSSGEMSFSKFSGGINDVENVFFMNIKSILNRMNAFDEEDYVRMRNGNLLKKLSEQVVQSKMNIYNEYIRFVKDAIEDNEEILLKLDQLLLEISKFNSLDEGELENMSAMKEIDELISKTKFYK